MRSWTILFPDIRGVREFLGSSGNGRQRGPRALDDEWFDPPFLDHSCGSIADLLRTSLLPEKLKGIYFGVEFCQRLIPTSDELIEALHLARAAGLSFSFLTPPVTDPGIETLRCRFSDLSGESSVERDIEVVVNDWGVLNLLKESFPVLKPVFGRMMNKMVRDPRVAPYYVSERAPSGGLTALRQSSITNPWFRRTLVEWGVERHEFDNLFQGIQMDEGGEEIFLSVYIPYGYVTTGRICMPGSFALGKADKFTEYMGCRRECKRFTHRLLNTRSPFSNKDMELIQRGNTIFYPNPWNRLESVLAGDAGEAVDRIVYQPGLPV
jgi:hypothetical protein